MALQEVSQDKASDYLGRNDHPHPTRMLMLWICKSPCISRTFNVIDLSLYHWLHMPMYPNSQSHLRASCSQVGCTNVGWMFDDFWVKADHAKED